jgi:tetratricopeptide (TPR) repeat protein
MAEPTNPQETSAETTDDSLEAALAAAFGAESAPRALPDSVLAALRHSVGAMPRVLLHDVAEDGGPVIKPRPEIDGGGRYQLLGEIARGGMGVILKGRDTDLGRDLAVKVLQETHQHVPEIVRRFVEEAQIGGQLQHPGIVPVYELGRFQDRRPYFTMKLVQGRTLAALLETRSDPLQDRAHLLSIFAQICQTVAYAHARGVIHRDLKPSNVMVGAFGEVLVMDWGLAKVLATGGLADDSKARQSHAAESYIHTVRTDSSAPGSRAGSVMGTPAYMAPEQARGEVDTLDERCDVFGLGAILCEILTGKPPHVGETNEEVQRLARAGDLTDAMFRLMICGADPDLLKLAQACLAATPGERPRHAGVVAREVTAYLASVQERLRSAELARAAAQAKALEERKTRRRTVALAAAIVLAVLMGGGGWWWVEHDRAARAFAEAQRDAEIERDASVALQEATVLQREGKLLEALAAARKAEGMLADRRDGLRLRVDELLADFTMHARVESIYSKKGLIREYLVSDHTFGERESPQSVGKWKQLEDVDIDKELTSAFEDYGIPVEKLDAEEAGKQIRARSIPVELAAALHDWAIWRRGTRARQDTSWKHLLAVARAADRDEWRTHLRGALENKDRAALEKLASQDSALALTAVSQKLLADGLKDVGAANEAVAFLRRAQRKHPGDFWLNVSLAGSLDWHFDRAGAEEAVRFYAAALAARPKSTLAQMGLGAALRHKGDLDEAIAAYKKAIELDQNSFLAHLNLGDVLDDKELYDEAVAAYKEAIRISPRNSDAHSNLGVTLAQQKKFDEAITVLKHAIDLRKDNAIAYFNLGLVLREKKLPAEAVTVLKEARRLRPRDFRTLMNLAEALHEKGARDEALDVYREAFRRRPPHSQTLLKLGATLRNRGLLDEAITAYREATGKILTGTLTKDDPTDGFPMTLKSHHKVHALPLEAGQPYLIDLKGTFDTFLRVEDSQKRTFLFNDDVRPDDLNSRLVFIPPQKDTYRLVVTSFKPGDTGSYTLSIQAAVKVGEPTLIKDQLQKTDMKDQQGKFFKLHKVKLTGGSPCTIELASSDFDTFLVLLDGAGKQALAHNDDIAPGNTHLSRLDLTPKADAEFTIGVTSFGAGQTGAYALTVQRYEAGKVTKKPILPEGK